MKKTYTGTLRYTTPEDLQKANIIIVIHNVMKYEDSGEDRREISYTGMTSWDIISGGEESMEVENYTDVVDDYHEYLILHFNDGRVATFRNSYVSMFIL